jgi:hypothetical protein
MKKTYSIIILILIALIAGCSVPRINIFKETPDPFKEYTLEGTGADKILLISLD